MDDDVARKYYMKKDRDHDSNVDMDITLSSLDNWVAENYMDITLKIPYERVLCLRYKVIAPST